MTAHKYGNDVDTDVIIPARYLNTSAPEELAAHCMEDIDPMFAGRVRHGDIIVAGRNFGCGSSREHAPLAIKASGISCVVAESFARLGRYDRADIARNFVRWIDEGFWSSLDVAFDGCGSSREHAPLAIKASGVACVIAESFARIFYRNALNIALPILECPAAANAISAGDEVSVNLETGEITDITTVRTFRAEPFPPFMMELIAAGGLAAYLKAKDK